MRGNAVYLFLDIYFAMIPFGPKTKQSWLAANNNSEMYLFMSERKLILPKVILHCVRRVSIGQLGNFHLLLHNTVFKLLYIFCKAQD